MPFIDNQVVTIEEWLAHRDAQRKAAEAGDAEPEVSEAEAPVEEAPKPRRRRSKKDAAAEVMEQLGITAEDQADSEPEAESE